MTLCLFVCMFMCVCAAASTSDVGGQVNAGPLYLGKAVPLAAALAAGETGLGTGSTAEAGDPDREPEWNQVALVTYPSKQFFDDLVHSPWMLGTVYIYISLTCYISAATARSSMHGVVGRL